MLPTDAVDPTHDDAEYCATITHVGFPANSFSGRQHPSIPTATIMSRKETRIVTIALNAVSGTAGAHHLETVYGWPVWRPSLLPEACPDSYAIFHTPSRSFQGIFHPDIKGEAHELHIMGGSGPRLTDQMWDMLQSTRTVVLCGGLHGDPSGPEIGRAIGQRRMRAVTGTALFADRVVPPGPRATALHRGSVRGEVGTHRGAQSVKGVADRGHHA